MSEEKIIMRILRDTGYIPMQGIIYRATVRVSLATPNKPPKDISPLFQLHATNPEDLETQIKNVEQEYRKLVKENPEFVKKIRVSEAREI